MPEELECVKEMNKMDLELKGKTKGNDLVFFMPLPPSELESEGGFILYLDLFNDCLSMRAENSSEAAMIATGFTEGRIPIHFVKQKPSANLIGRVDVMGEKIEVKDKKGDLMYYTALSGCCFKNRSHFKILDASYSKIAEIRISDFSLNIVILNTLKGLFPRILLIVLTFALYSDSEAYAKVNRIAPLVTDEDLKRKDKSKARKPAAKDKSRGVRGPDR